MDIGLTIFPTDTSIPIVQLGQLAEELGFESLFVPEHTHIPVSRKTPYPAGGDLPPEYSRTWDPFIALAAVAATTERLKVGTAISLIPQHDPIVLAKTTASLQFLSNGRFELGIGPGWNVEEMNDHGTAFEDRYTIMRERVEAMRAIWTQDEAEYHGTFVDFEPLWSWPKPPTPIPVIVAGWGPQVLDRVLRYGDGWIPIGGRGAALKDRIAELNERAAAAGRGHIPVTIYQLGLRQEHVEEYAEVGVSRLLGALPPASPEDTIARVRRYAELLG